jgi:hypothetical protein
MSIQYIDKHFNLLEPEGSNFMSLGGQFYMSPDTLSATTNSVVDDGSGKYTHT